MHGSARQRCYGAAQLLQQFAFLKLKNSHIRPPVNMSLISNIRRYSSIHCPANFIETDLCLGIAGNRRGIQRRWCRSEEHTSELQSLMRISYAVFCLKKKTNTTLKQ